MLKIKLQRIGKKGQPQYRIVVRADRVKQGGKSVAEIGYYNPLVKTAVFDIDKKVYADWLQKGAQPTDTIRKLANSTDKPTK